MAQLFSDDFSVHAGRQLWSAVVARAVEDLEEFHYNSVEYQAAVAFFTSTAQEWREHRWMIADFLGLHADDIERLGRRVIAERHGREPPPARPVVVKPAPPPPTALPCPEPKPKSKPRRKVDWLENFRAGVLRRYA